MRTSFKHVHILGVCGTLMGAFAALLKRQGVRVTGSDQNVYPPMSDVLSQCGVELFSPYRSENLDLIQGKPDLVVVGNVISKSNVEMQAVIDRGWSYVSLPEYMENHLLPETQNIVVSGTHGKTTTSSLLAHALHVLGANPSYFIGGVSQDLPHSFHVEEHGKFFVLEGDEYDTAFWDKVPKFNHYLPNDVILTSVEYDHADIYPDFDAVKRAFLGLMQRVRSPGKVIACNETSAVQDVVRSSLQPVITYARSRDFGADYCCSEVEADGPGVRFRVLKKVSGSYVSHCDGVKIQLPGVYNAVNALAVFIELESLGYSPSEIKKALASFKGVKRRQEERGEVKGVLVIDDFAHHPTAVKETLSGLFAKYEGRRFHVVFEPRSATSRRRVFQKEYGIAFDGADFVWIAEAFDTSKIPAELAFSSQELVQDLKDRGLNANFFSTPDQGVDAVRTLCRPGDVVMVLSNGGFGGFIPKLLEALKF